MDLHDVCRLCESSKIKLLYQSMKNRVTVFRCKSCGFTFVGNRFSEADLKAYYGPHAVSFFTEVDAYTRFTRLQRITQIKKLILNTKEVTTPKMLDVGAGSGFFLYLAKQHGFEVSGIRPIFLTHKKPCPHPNSRMWAFG